MATWDRNFTGGSYAGNWHCRLDYWDTDGLDANSNQSLVRLRMYIWGDSGYSQNGTWVPRGRGSWMGEYGGNQSRSIGSSLVLMASWDGWVGHDANGDRYVTVGTYCNAPINDMGWADIGWNLTKLYRAPSIQAAIADQITNNSVRLGTEINDYGLGTSAATRMYYKLTTSGSYSQTSDQGDVGGYNYWTVNSLAPNSKYDYLARWWNNNGSTSDMPSSYPNASHRFLTLASGSIGTPSKLATTVDFPITMVASQTSEANATVKVQYRKVGNTTWLDSATNTLLSSTIQVTGLLPNTQYEYRLAATNATGTWTGSTATVTTLPAGKLVYPNGDVKNAIPRLVFPNGDVDMININLVD